MSYQSQMKKANANDLHWPKKKRDLAGAIVELLAEYRNNCGDVFPCGSVCRCSSSGTTVTLELDNAYIRFVRSMPRIKVLGYERTSCS